MRVSTLGALISAVVCSFPAVAIAQTNPTDSAYLSDLHSFLQSEDRTTYRMATQSMTPADSIWAAKMFCETFASGVSPADAYAVYTSAAIGQGETYGDQFTDELAYAVGLYGGAVMNLGAAHYCPQYQPQVQQALRAL